MAAKKKPLLKPKKVTKKGLPQKPSVPSENITEHGSLKLSDVQRLTLNWESAELKSLTSTLKLKSSEYEAYYKKIDPQGVLRKLQAEVASLSESVKARESKFISLCRDTGSKLGLDTSKKWSYDDETGLVHVEETETKAS